jgi:hypothetical protein
MSITRALVAILALAALGTGCEDKAAPKPAVTPPPKRGPVAVTPAPATSAAAPTGTPEGSAAKPAEAGEAFSVEGLGFATPGGWTKVAPANAMRLAELHAPGGAVVVFSSAGGEIQANIQRWSSQFQGAPAATAERTVAGLKVHTVDIAGTYSGMNEAAQNNYALHGAIIETGGQPVFVKMTGPAEAVKAAAPAFDAMVDGMTKK